MTGGRRATGRGGEEIAAQHLSRRGYRIIDRNWRTRFGEIDLIVRDGDTIVFVEVRTRLGGRLGTAAESIRGAKRRQLVKMAQQYLQQHGGDAVARIDVVAIDFDGATDPRVDHLIGAVDAY